MDGGIILIVFGFVVAILLAWPKPPRGSSRQGVRRPPPPTTTSQRKSGVVAPRRGTDLCGPAYVIDGDTIVVQKVHVRLFGIDAPELDHPFGQKAKWAMVRLCKGQRISVRVVDSDTHGRTVGHCVLPDGRDLSAELVKQGLAIDWPKYSNGRYGRLEPEGVRKKLWLADARQKGRMHVWEAYEQRKARRR